MVTDYCRKQPRIKTTSIRTGNGIVDTRVPHYLHEVLDTVYPLSRSLSDRRKQDSNSPVEGKKGVYKGFIVLFIGYDVVKDKENPIEYGDFLQSRTVRVLFPAIIEKVSDGRSR